MTHGSLFSGIGGFDLAAEWMGWENKFHCEWNPFGQQVLKHYWPEAELFTDITKSDFTKYANRIDVLTGGFPCQPYSTAGKRLGKEDERHLWPEMLRAIREIQPRWVVGENVRGLISWNGGMVFDEVQADLEDEGYEVLPFLLPACAVNAPHRRDRIWFVAINTKRKPNGRYNTPESKGTGLQVVGNILDKAGWDQSTDHSRSPSIDGVVAHASGINGSIPIQQRGQQQAENADTDWENESGYASNSKGEGLEGRTEVQKQGAGRPSLCSKELTSSSDGVGLWRKNNGTGKSGFIGENSPGNYWRDFPTQPPVCRGNDGLPTELLRQRIREDCMGVISEKEIDKIISKAVTQHRTESIKAYGNAIVPQVALQIFKAIEQYEISNSL